MERVEIESNGEREIESNGERVGEIESSEREWERERVVREIESNGERERVGE